ncbi:glycosyltransferase family 4 protein [Larkinella rosea]|uniref:Glycosyltransferase family 1 protein n=1 Tax=Larkinella rosea TaxID=2025312 RepID=A0A3P1BMR8_9BACT|nr:glycosyltransferase family 4 protein [Larkinella rosea]RRB02328.1 glycosyltransferase family 1 protein [Larkinella rosea]
MKIAVWHNLRSGGGSRALHQHIKGLAQRGHTIEVWTSSEGDSKFLDVDQYVTKTHVLPLSMETRIRDGYWDKWWAMQFEPETRIRRMLDFCRRCADEINAGDFDVLFANACIFFSMPYIGRFINIPKALYLGEPNRFLFESSPNLIWEGLPPASGNWKKADYRDKYWEDIFKIRQARVRVREEIYNYHSYDKVLVNSYFSNENLLRAYGGAGEVCYLGIDASLFPFQNLPREPFVMGLGAFFQHKRPDLAIESLALIPEKTRPRLVWVGDMGDTVYVNKLKELSQQRNVQFEPREKIPHEELIRLLNTASCLLYTSTLEPFGLAPLEANACGLPVVAVAEGGVRETVIDNYNGLLVNRKPEEMARAVERVLTNSGEFERLSRNARRLVQEQWTFEKAIDRIEDALFHTIGKERGVVVK